MCKVKKVTGLFSFDSIKYNKHVCFILEIACINRALYGACNGTIALSTER